MRNSLVLLTCVALLGLGASAAFAEEPAGDPAHPASGEHPEPATGVDGAGDEAKPHGKAEGDGHGDHGEAKPEIIDPKGDLALWSLVTFVVLLVVLRAFAWGPITSGLDTRESRIRDDIAQAEAARTRANQLLSEHEERLKSVEAEIREMRSEARAAADQVKAEAVDAGKAEAAALVAKARTEISQERERAEEELKRELAGMVVSAAEMVIGRKMNDGDEQRLADEALQQFAGSVN